MSIGVKAFLYNDWKGDAVEIRRFSVDSDVAACYDYLTQKLCRVFPTLYVDCIEVYWEDADGDKIKISCDADLVEALKQFDGTVFRVLVGGCEPKSDRRRPDPSNEDLECPDEDAVKWQCSPLAYTPGEVSGPPGRGITCDGCRGPLHDTVRYECQTCPDYVLCSACESKGEHEEHTMLRVDRPLAHPYGISHPDLTLHGGHSNPGEEWPPPAEGGVTRDQSQSEQKGFLSTIGEVLSSYLLDPLVGRAGGDPPNTQKQWQPREACSYSSEGDEGGSQETSLTLNEQLALARLMSMGYDNEQGWLTELVRAKKGDMEEINDLLLP